MVERIGQMVEITPLPRMPEHVLGVVNRKGQIVHVFNLCRRFRLPERDVDPRDHLIFARTRHRPVALAVDAAGEVIEADGQNLIASESVLPGP
jgi:purine-binding chemotaxis protein CheW